jgi:hypothetical protein
MKTSCIYDHVFQEQEKNSFSHNLKLLDNKSLWLSFIYKFRSQDVLMLVGEPVPFSKDAKMASLIQVRHSVGIQKISFLAWIVSHSCIIECENVGRE